MKKTTRTVAKIFLKGIERFVDQFKMFTNPITVGIDRRGTTGNI
jgi:hypothetical protein